jgi:hypothetical protein
LTPWDRTDAANGHYLPYQQIARKAVQAERRRQPLFAARKNGSKLWRHAFRFDGKQKLVALGTYQIEEHLDPQMVIEQEITGWVFFTLNNDWWFDWARGSSSPKWICYPTSFGGVA